MCCCRTKTSPQTFIWKRGTGMLTTQITAASNNPSFDNILPIVSHDNQTDKIDKSSFKRPKN